MKIEVAMIAGEASKTWLAGFTKQVDRLEAIMGSAKVKAAANEDDADEDADEDLDEEEEVSVPKKKKAAVTDDDDETETEDEPEEEEESESEDDADEEEPAPKKKAAGRPAKKMTLEELNAVAAKFAKAIGGQEGIDKVKSILKKNFKLKSLKEMDESDYPKFAELLGAGKKKKASAEDDE